MTEAASIESYFDRLWPLPRSILGPAYRDSLSILDEIMPMQRLNWDTGSKILDWVVPQEWSIEDAYIIDPNGKKIVDFKKSNLHVMGYSEPISGNYSLRRLKEHLYFLQQQPDAIPYITSYYKKNWGFAMPYDQFVDLQEGNYNISIQSSFDDGQLVIGHAQLGQSDGLEINFSSYLCHPSMANNELSGPLVLSHLFKYLKNHRPELKNNYNFYLMPETIGSIALLDRYGIGWKNNLFAGYHLTCIGDGGGLTMKHSRQKKTIADAVGKHVACQYGCEKFIDFNPAFGSDERQFCSQGFDLPYCSFMRTMYTEYPQYHTSLDDKSLMNFETMNQSVMMLVDLVDIFEMPEHQGFNIYKAIYPFGEPQLGKRGLFRDVSVKTREENELAFWWLLNYCDGLTTLFEIEDLSALSLRVLDDAAQHLLEARLLDKVRRHK